MLILTDSKISDLEARKILNENKPVVILGPTASGKTKIALKFKKILREGGKKSAILSIDSRQQYKELKIATGRRDAPAYLSGFLSIDTQETVFDFKQRFFKILKKLILKNIRPIITVGTPFYWNQIYYDQTLPPKDENLSKKIRQMSAEEILKNLDQITLTKIDKSNKRRLERALEVLTLTKKSIYTFEQSAKPSFDASIIFINTPTDLLFKKVDRRIAKFFKQGLRDEFERLRDKFAGNEVLKTTLGYAELFENDDLKAKELIVKNTKNYIKRQRTFFKRLTATG